MVEEFRVVEAELALVREDVRDLRRLLLVSAILAVAAVIVAVIALLDQPETPTTQPQAGQGAQIAVVERKLADRLDELEQQLKDAPSADDVRKLDRRVKASQKDLSAAAKLADDNTEDLAQLSARIDELEGRVEDLESQPPPEAPAR